jgi:hypothetical protein
MDGQFSSEVSLFGLSTYPAVGHNSIAQPIGIIGVSKFSWRQRGKLILACS